MFTEIWSRASREIGSVSRKVGPDSKSIVELCSVNQNKVLTVVATPDRVAIRL